MLTTPLSLLSTTRPRPIQKEGAFASGHTSNGPISCPPYNRPQNLTRRKSNILNSVPRPASASATDPDTWWSKWPPCPGTPPSACRRAHPFSADAARSRRHSLLPPPPLPFSVSPRLPCPCSSSRSSRLVGEASPTRWAWGPRG